MTRKKTKTSVARGLSTEELTNIAGGQEIYTREFAGGPPSFYPKGGTGTAGSNEVNENGTQLGRASGLTVPLLIRTVSGMRDRTWARSRLVARGYAAVRLDQ